MKIFAFIVLIAVVVVARPATDSGDAAVKVLHEENLNDGINPWHHSLKLSNGIENEVTGQIVHQGEENESIAVHGVYSHIGPDGVNYTVEYVADANGFQARGTHLPVAPQ